MGDQDDRGMGLSLRSTEDFDDLRLDRHVERGRRLVGDEHARVVGDRHRDHRALSHSARELVRVLVDAPLGERHADELEQLDRPLAGGLFADLGVMHHDRLRDLIADREHGIERRHRVLEDHRHLPTPDVAQPLLRHLEHVVALEDRLAARDASRRCRDETEDRHRRDALARSRLPHDAEHLAGLEIPADVGHGVDDTVLRRELDGELAYGENGLSHGFSAADRARRVGRRRRS